MNVLVCLEHHFLQKGNEIYCRLLPGDYFRRLLEVWDEVVVLARLAQCDRQPDVPPMNTQGVRFVGLPDYLGLRQFLWHRHEIKQIAAQTVARTDAMVLRCPGAISTIICSVIRGSDRPFGIEVVGDPRDAFARGAVRHPLRPLIRHIFQRNLRKQCREASATAYVTAHKLQQRYPPTPGTFTTNYSNVELRDDNILDGPRTNFAADGVWRLVMVGTFSQMYKGQDVLLHALSRVKNQLKQFELVFVGQGKHQQEIESLARRLGLQSQTKFLGELPIGAAVQAQLDRADLFVLPSRTEGLPRAIIEAMGRGLPCIGTSVGGIPELLDPMQLVPPNDVKALAAKILELFQDREGMKRLSIRNLDIAAQYRKKHLDARRLEFYRQVRQGAAAWL